MVVTLKVINDKNKLVKPPVKYQAALLCIVE